MEMRLQQLSQLQCFVEGVDKDLTMIIQNLQWNRKRLLGDLPMGMCRYNNNHKLPLDKIQSHEAKCFMKLQGYSEGDAFLSEPLDSNANTLVKLSTQQIFMILNDASRCNPLLKRGNRWETRSLEPRTLERLQATYTADERREIHNAVVQAVPSCHDLTDLALLSGNKDEAANKAKSRVEILAELRDVKRRRPKYRMASKTRNYSDVLRDIIKTQMEFYSETSQSSGPTKTALRQYGQEIKNSGKITGSHGCEKHKLNDNYRPFNHKKGKDGENYKHRNAIREKTSDYESRDRQKLPSYRKNECHCSASSERNSTVRHTSGSYRSKRNINSDESDDSRTSINVSRPKNRRRESNRYAGEGQSRSYRKNNSVNTIGMEKMHVESKRLEFSERESRHRGNKSSPRYEDSEPCVCIKTERMNSPKIDMKKDADSNPSITITAISNTNRESIAVIKVEKAVIPNCQDKHGSTESDSSGNTENENRKSNWTIKRENDDDVTKTRYRQEDSGHYNTSPNVDRRATNAGTRIVYAERSTERQHRHLNSTQNILSKREKVEGAERIRNERTNNSDGKRYNNVKNVYRDGDKSLQCARHGYRGDQRYRTPSSSDSSTDTTHRHNSRRDEKYHGSSDTRKNYYEGGDPRRNYEKYNSYYDKEHSEAEGRGAAARRHGDTLKRKRYS